MKTRLTEAGKLRKKFKMLFLVTKCTPHLVIGWLNEKLFGEQ